MYKRQELHSTFEGIARFLGMVKYFHKYIPHLAEIAAPLTPYERRERSSNGAQYIKTRLSNLKKVLYLPQFCN